MGLYNRDLAEQQIAHRDTDERRKCGGIISIKKKMTIWWNYNNKESLGEMKK